MIKAFLAHPIWQRIGFETIPDENESGKGIGVVIFDNVTKHPAISNLRGRLTRIIVNEDNTIETRDIINDEEEEGPPYLASCEHGNASLFILGHKQLKIENQTYVGLIPAANFFIISYYEPEKIEKAIEWVINKKDKLNIRVILSTIVPRGENIGYVTEKNEDIYANILMKAYNAGILIVTANGNSPTQNNYQPIEFLAVGGYDDGGKSGLNNIREHKLSSYGFNGDGYARPDVLAPFSYLPIPYYETEKSDLYTPYYDFESGQFKLSYFGGSSGASTTIAGICVHLLALYPNLSNEELINTLICTGYKLINSKNKAKIINVKSAKESIKNLIKHNRPLTRDRECVKRALQLTTLIKNNEISREELWSYVTDEDFRVRKVAILSLGYPRDEVELEKYWNHFYNCEDDYTGVREAWVYIILGGTNKEELDKWMALIRDVNIDVRLCVKIFLERFYKDAPKIEHNPNQTIEWVHKITEEVLKWYSKL